MKNFCNLISDLRGTTGQDEQKRILKGYLEGLPTAEADRVVSVLSGKTLVKMWTRPKLRTCFEESQVLPAWLLARCLEEGPDVAETLARCWPREGQGLGIGLEELIKVRLPGLTQAKNLWACWDACRTPERIVVNRLLIGQAPINLPDTLFDPATTDPGDDQILQEIDVELMYCCFPEFSFGQEVDGGLQLFSKVRVENPAHLKVLLDFIEKNMLEKKGPVQIVKRGLRGRIGFLRKVSSPRHKSGFKVEGAKLLTLYPPGEFWEVS